MPFGRRKKTDIFLFFKNSIKFLFSFKRTKKYILVNLKRMKGSSHEIAIGLACGISISFTPFLGLHALLAITLAQDIASDVPSTYPSHGSNSIEHMSHVGIRTVCMRTFL